AGTHLADAGAEAAGQADVQTLKVSHGHLDLDRVRELDAPLASVTRALDAAGRSAGRADSTWLLPAVANRLDTFSNQAHPAQHDVANASAAVANLPDILGGAGERNYFVVFATPSESRDLGGFMGAYGILTADDGKITLSKT